MDEALALHLAVRLFSTRMDKRNPSAASAIRKISVALEKMAPSINKAMSQSANLADGDCQIKDINYIETLTDLLLKKSVNRVGFY